MTQQSHYWGISKGNENKISQRYPHIISLYVESKKAKLRETDSRVAWTPMGPWGGGNRERLVKGVQTYS